MVISYLRDEMSVGVRSADNVINASALCSAKREYCKIAYNKQMNNNDNKNINCK